MPGTVIYVPDPFHLQLLSIRLYNIPPHCSAAGVIGPTQACQQPLPHTQSQQEQLEEEGEEEEERGLIGCSKRSKRWATTDRRWRREMMVKWQAEVGETIDGVEGGGGGVGGR